MSKSVLRELWEDFKKKASEPVDERAIRASVLKKYEPEIMAQVKSARDELAEYRELDHLRRELDSLTVEGAVNYNWGVIDSAIENAKSLKSARAALLCKYDFIPEDMLTNESAITRFEDFGGKLDDEIAGASKLYRECIMACVHSKMNDISEKELSKLDMIFGRARAVIHPLKKPDLLYDGKQVLILIPSHIEAVLTDRVPSRAEVDLENVIKEPRMIEIPIDKGVVTRAGVVFKKYTLALADADIKQNGKLTPIGKLYYKLNELFNPIDNNGTKVDYFEQRERIPEDSISDAGARALKLLQAGKTEKGLKLYKLVKGSLIVPNVKPDDAKTAKFAYAELEKFLVQYLNGKEFLQSDSLPDKGFLAEIGALFPKYQSALAETVANMQNHSYTAVGNRREILKNYCDSLRPKKIKLCDVKVPIGEIMADEIGRYGAAEDLKKYLTLCELVVNTKECENRVLEYARSRLGGWTEHEKDNAKLINRLNPENNYVLNFYKSLNKEVI